MRHLDLCSGIGGFALAARWAGIETVGFCEIEDYPRRVLAKNFPGVPIHHDIHDLDGKQYGAIDLITAGYPCQPFSFAGKRRGAEDDRHIWPEVLRIVTEARPAWTLFENVFGHVSMGLDEVLSDLEAEGYSARCFVVPACAVNAPHRRDRVWLLANANRDPRKIRGQHNADEEKRFSGRSYENGSGGDDWREPRAKPNDPNVADTPSKRLEGCKRQEHEGRGKGFTASSEILADTGSNEREGRTEKPLPRQSDLSGQSGRGSENLAPRWATEPDLAREIDGLPAELDGYLSNEAKTRAIQIMRDLWRSDEAQALWQSLGGYGRVHPAEVLLAFLCEYAQRKDEGRLAMECEKARQECLRGLWQHIEIARSSLQPRHYKQHAREFANALRQMSHNSPSLYPQAWASGQWEEGVERVAHGVPKRVDRIRGLGNAIVPQVAYRFMQLIHDEFTKGERKQ